jgi:hypothetical protein
VRYVGTFGGPSAPWMDEDDEFLPADDDVRHQLARMASALARALELRAARLRADPSFDTIAVEIRMQMAALAISNDVFGLMDMGELYADLFNLPTSALKPETVEAAVWDQADTVWPSDTVFRDPDEDDTGSSHGA